MEQHNLNVKSARRTIRDLMSLEFRLADNDYRTLIRDERMGLQGAMYREDSTQEHLDEVEAEARRVYRMYAQAR